LNVYLKNNKDGYIISLLRLVLPEVLKFNKKSLKKETTPLENFNVYIF